MKKSAGIIIKDKSLLVLRTRGKDMYFAPGGKPEINESIEDALIRELNEEIGISISKSDISPYGVFSAPAAGNEDIVLTMSVFWVDGHWENLLPCNEIEELLWVNSKNINKITLSSIFLNEVFYSLVNRGYIS
ncbi:MAG: NUDIX domain-containing protein [Reinekea sp.]